MTQKTNNTARIHQHAGQIALRIGEGVTMYLTPKLADNLSMELMTAACQIKNGYHYETTDIGEG